MRRTRQEEMRIGSMAIPLPGSDSWCKWRKAEALGELHEYSHPPPLCTEVQNMLRPIYEDLSSDNLLERRLGGHTQNNNESFNSVLWSMAPKHIFCSAKTIELVAFLSACVCHVFMTVILYIISYNTFYCFYKYCC